MTIGALALTNQEIRRSLVVAEQKRLERDRTERPFRYLDRVITQLEGLHLRRLHDVPMDFLPALDAVTALLPPAVRPPRGRQRTIAGAIEQCFDLQGKLLRLRRAREASRFRKVHPHTLTS